MSIKKEEENTNKKAFINRLFESSLLASSPPENFLEQLTEGIRHALHQSSPSYLTEGLSQEKLNESLYRSETHIITNKTQGTYKLTDISSKAFTILREKIFGISMELFEEEWDLPQERLTANTGAGRSGSLFCFSKTKRFIGKTIPKSEVVALNLFLPEYFEYMKTPQNANNSLIMKLFGLFHYQSANNDIHLLVFGNVLWAEREDYYANDPLLDRDDNLNIIDNNIENNDQNYDNNFINNYENNLNNNNNNNNEINIEEESEGKSEIDCGVISDKSILKDCMKDKNIILLPIHHIFDLKGRLNKTKRYHADEIEIAEEKKAVKKDKYLDRLFYFGDNRDFIITQLRKDVSLLQNANLMDYSLLIGIHDVTDESNLLLSSKAKGFYSYGQIFFLGIIDCLTYYGTAKKMAQSFKKFLWTKDQLSTVEAQYYSERFLQYFDGIFPEGSPINAVQFKPRDATGKIENIEIALNCISEVVYQVFSSLNLSGQSITLPVRAFSGAVAVDCEIKIYNPKVFSDIQNLMKIDLDKFKNELTIPSIQFRATYQEQESLNTFRPRIFFPSSSKQFLLQTISSREMDNLLLIADDYYTFLTQNNKSFLVKVVCAFRVTISILQKLYIIIMENPFYSKYLAYDTIYNIHGDNIEVDPYLPQVNIKSHNFGLPKFENLISSEKHFRFGQKKNDVIAILTKDMFFLQDKAHIDYSVLISEGELRNCIGEENDQPISISEYFEGEMMNQVCGITSIWKRFGIRERFSTIISRGLNVNPNTYAVQLIKMLDELLI